MERNRAKVTPKWSTSRCRAAKHINGLEWHLAVQRRGEQELGENARQDSEVVRSVQVAGRESQVRHTQRDPRVSTVVAHGQSGQQERETHHAQRDLRRVEDLGHDCGSRVLFCLLDRAARQLRVVFPTRTSLQ